MRPELALLTKHFYASFRLDGGIKDHASVLEYEDVRGVQANLYLFNHSNPEAEDAEMKSPYNIFEAEMIERLVRYLVLQGSILITNLIGEISRS